LNHNLRGGQTDAAGYNQKRFFAWLMAEDRDYGIQAGYSETA